MSTSTELLDTLKGLPGIKSDYAIAKALDVHTQQVSRWRTGTGQMSPDYIAKAAELAGLDPAPLIAKVEAERAQTPAARKLFEQLHDAAELVDLLKRSPALRAQIEKQMREFAETIENEEEKARFLSISKSVCILCYIAPVVRPVICIRRKLASRPQLAISRAKTEL